MKKNARQRVKSVRTTAHPANADTPLATTSANTRTTDELLNKADLAYYRVAGFATVLSRLADLQESNADQTVTVEFSDEREAHFWRGIGYMAREIEAAADVMFVAQPLGDEHIKGGAR